MFLSTFGPQQPNLCVLDNWIASSGMEFIDQINAEYKEKPNQGAINNRGNAYLNSEFPQLSFIQSAKTSAGDA